MLNCENLSKNTQNVKKMFFLKYLTYNNAEKADKHSLVEYFDKYQSFCFDLTIDSVLKGNLNFNYK